MNTIQERLMEMRERCDEATPGPWEWDGKVPQEYSLGDWSNSAPWLVSIEDGYPILEGEIAGRSENINFIARARTDLPLVLDALEVAVQALRVTYDHPLGSMVDDALKQITKILEKK